MTDYDNLLVMLDRVGWVYNTSFDRVGENIFKYIDTFDGRKNEIRFKFEQSGNFLSVSSLTDDI